MKKIAVIGAGPAGIMAALAASEQGCHVDLYDQNEKIGKKLFITGKGRCNLTNSRPIEDFFDNIPTNSSFLYSALYTFTNDMLIDLIEQAGTPLKEERGGRIFPKSDKSSDIIKAFLKLLKENKVTILLNRKVTQLLCADSVCLGIRVDGEKIYYDAVVLCSGGSSYPSTGSDGSGYKLAQELGHTLIPPEPALVGLDTKEKWSKQVAGLTLKNIGLTLKKQGKTFFTETGEALFTHTGISGPVVLSASSFIKKPYSDYTIEIDLKPGLDNQKLDKRIQRDFSTYQNKAFKNALNDLLPKSLIPEIIKLSGIDPDKKVNSITKEERLKLGSLLKSLPFHIEAPGDLKGAIITRGGISTKEVDPTTMQSKLIKNLYFAGEILDVDALTGGFNIQIAVSTGYLAGLSVSEG